MSRVIEMVRRNDETVRHVIAYTEEHSSLSEINQKFPFVLGRSFTGWIKEGGAVLEVGGGVHQVAAREVLTDMLQCQEYLGYDARVPEPEVLDALQADQRYRFRQGGVADLADAIGDSRFDLAFAHNVAQHLPHPFLLLREMHDSLVEGGVLFVNGIHVDRHVAQDLQNAWLESDQVYSITQAHTGGSIARQGIISISVGLVRTSEELILPEPTEELLSVPFEPVRTLIYRAPHRRSA